MTAQIDLANIRPYGDTLNDGGCQLSFTLPMQDSEVAREAARQLCLKMGLQEPKVVYSHNLGKGYTFFVTYGSLTHSIDTTKIHVAKAEMEEMSMDEVNLLIREHIKRHIVVIGAATGSDAHTVGIDAIINMKGYKGEYGLERYSEIEAVNLGGQVPNELLLNKVKELKADAILISQVITQKNLHLRNLTELVDLLEAERLRENIVLVVGGPRISHQLARELGYDAGFGTGTIPNQVASFIVQEILRRRVANQS